MQYKVLPRVRLRGLTDAADADRRCGRRCGRRGRARTGAESYVNQYPPIPPHGIPSQGKYKPKTSDRSE